LGVASLEPESEGLVTLVDFVVLVLVLVLVVLLGLLLDVLRCVDRFFDLRRVVQRRRLTVYLDLEEVFQHVVEDELLGPVQTGFLVIAAEADHLDLEVSFRHDPRPGGLNAHVKQQHFERNVLCSNGGLEQVNRLRQGARHLEGDRRPHRQELEVVRGGDAVGLLQNGLLHRRGELAFLTQLDAAHCRVVAHQRRSARGPHQLLLALVYHRGILAQSRVGVGVLSAGPISKFFTELHRSQH